jgi:hypothetical protein
MGGCRYGTRYGYSFGEGESQFHESLTLASLYALHLPPSYSISHHTLERVTVAGRCMLFLDLIADHDKYLISVPALKLALPIHVQQMSCS